MRERGRGSEREQRGRREKERERRERKREETVLKRCKETQWERQRGRTRNIERDYTVMFFTIQMWPFLSLDAGDGYKLRGLGWGIKRIVRRSWGIFTEQPQNSCQWTLEREWERISTMLGINVTHNHFIPLSYPEELHLSLDTAISGQHKSNIR